MNSSTCPHPKCKQAPYTPSGLQNFACLYWRDKEFRKNEQIRKDLKKVKDLAQEAKKKSFDLDHLINIRDKLEAADTIFDAEQYIRERTETVSDENQSVLDQLAVITEQQDSIRMNIQRLTSLNSRLSVTITEVFDQKLDNSGRVTQAIKAGNDIVLKIKPPKHPSNDELHSQLLNTVKERDDVVNTMKTFLNDLIANIFRLKDNNSLPQRISYLKDHLAKEQLHLQHFCQHSKILTRVNLKPLKYDFFVCNDYHIARRLMMNYPNVFNMTEFKFDSHPPVNISASYYSRHRINLVPEFSWIPPDVDFSSCYLNGLTYHSPPPTYQGSSGQQNQQFGLPINFRRYFEFDIMKYSKHKDIHFDYSDIVYIDDESKIFRGFDSSSDEAIGNILALKGTSKI